MNLEKDLFGNKQKANCKVYIIEPSKQDSMFPTCVFVEGIPEGLGLSFDSESASKVDGFAKAAIIGEYHWLNNENSIEPFVMLFKDMEKIACQFYKTEGHMTSYVGDTNEILNAIPEGVDLAIVFVYTNAAKGTKLWVRFDLMATGDKTDNHAAMKLFNYMISAKH